MGHLSKIVEISLWIILSVGPFGMLKVNSVGNYGRKIFLNKEPFFPKVFLPFRDKMTQTTHKREGNERDHVDGRKPLNTY